MATLVGHYREIELMACREAPAEILKRLFPCYGIGKYCGFERPDYHLLNGEAWRLDGPIWIKEIPQSADQTVHGIREQREVTGTLADLCRMLEARDADEFRRVRMVGGEPRGTWQIWQPPLAAEHIQWYVFRNVVDAQQRDPRYHADRKTADTPAGRFAQALLGNVPEEFSALLNLAHTGLGKLARIDRPKGVRFRNRGDPFERYGEHISTASIG